MLTTFTLITTLPVNDEYRYLHPKYIPADATRTVKIIARLTHINHLRSVHPALDLRIRSDESVPDDADDDGENKACSGC